MTDTTSVFLYGTLRYAPLLEAVLGRAVQPEPASLANYTVLAIEGATFPMIAPKADAIAEGGLVRDLSADDVARLDFYEGSHGYDLVPVSVHTTDGDVEAKVYMPRVGRWSPDGPWDLERWSREFGTLTARAAPEFMVLMGNRSPEDAAAAYPQMLMRAQSALRAEALAAPTTLRHDGTRGDIAVSRQDRPHIGYFAVSQDDLRFPRFDGRMSETVSREAFQMADAVTVLPYDPSRDRVLVIEQFRYGAYMRGDPHPWLLEPIAGRIDPGETPEDTVHREAEEEAGLALSALHAIGASYPSPGGVTEYLFNYVGIADLPDDAARIGGLLSEQEDIRAHVVSFDKLMALVASGEASTAPLVLSAYWLALNRDRLA